MDNTRSGDVSYLVDISSLAVLGCSVRAFVSTLDIVGGILSLTSLCTSIAVDSNITDRESAVSEVLEDVDAWALDVHQLNMVKKTMVIYTEVLNTYFVNMLRQSNPNGLIRTISISNVNLYPDPQIPMVNVLEVACNTARITATVWWR